MSLAGILFLLIAQAAQSQTIPSTVDPFAFPSARFYGLGGTHTAIADESNVFFTNPAGLANIERTVNISEFTFAVNDLNTMINVLAGSTDLSIASIFSDVQSASFEAAGPLSLSWINRGFGLGLFNTTYLEFSKNSSTFTLVDAAVSEEISLLCGYAWRIGDVGDTTFDFGFLTKLFYRGVFSKADITIWEARHIFEDLLTDYAHQTQIGAGLDAGFRFAAYEAFSVALAVRDIFSPAYVMNSLSFQHFLDQTLVNTGMSQVKPSLQIGFGYHIATDTLTRYITGIKLMLDYSNILGLFEPVIRDPLLNLGAGVEVKLLHAMSLRLGWYEMSVALGFGLDMSLWQMDIAFYGREYGMRTGQYRTYSIAAALLLRYD